MQVRSLAARTVRCLELGSRRSLPAMLDDFLAFLPRLLGAVIVGTVGAAILLLGPFLVLRSLRKKPVEQRSIGAKVSIVLLWVWLGCAGLILLSLTVNTLGVAWLQRSIDQVAEWVPRLVVAALIIAAGFALLRLFFRFGRGVLMPRLQRFPLPLRRVLVALGYIPIVVVGILTVIVAVDQIRRSAVQGSFALRLTYPVGVVFGVLAGHWPSREQPPPPMRPPPPPQF